MKCKRILSMLLTLCMVMSLFAGTTVTASAAGGATTLYVNGVDMLSESSTAPTGVSYDKSTNTLTLTDAELSTPYSGKDDGSRKLTAIIYSKQGLTINLVGNSTITYSDSQDAKMLIGIMNTYGDLKFTGDGSLTIKNAVETGGTDKLCYGIDAYGTLTVDGPTITIDADKTDTLTCQAEYGVLLMGTFAINSGTVTIRTRNTTGSNTALYTITGKNNALGSGAKLIAEAGNRSSGDTNSYGIITESSLQLGAGASLRASGGEKALKIDEGMIKAASADLTLSATGSATPKAATKDLQKISSDMDTLTSLQYKTIEVTASAAGGAAEYATAELKLNGYTAGAAFKQATITTTSSTGFESISLAGFMDKSDGKFDPVGNFDGAKTYYVMLKMPRSTGYELQENDGKPVGVTLEGATPEPLSANKEFLIFKMNSRPAAAAPTFTATAELKLNGYTAGAAFKQATITTTSSTGFESISLAGFMDKSDGKFDPVGNFDGAKTYYVMLKMPRSTGYELQEDGGKPVGVTLEGATPEPLSENKEFLIFKMNSKPAAAAPTFTDGLGKTDCTFDTYTKDAKNEKGYTFAGWFGDDGKELTSAADATAGTTYTARWTKNGKTVRTTALDFYNDASNEWKTGCTQNGTLWTNDAEGWSWDTASQTLTLNGVTIDAQLDENTYGAIEVFGNAKIITANGTENFVCSRSEDGENAAIFVQGDLTISGNGKLTAVGEVAGIEAENGDIHINAPLSASAIGSAPEAAIRIASRVLHKITIDDPSLTIKQPEGGYIGEEEMCILEKGGENAAMKVVIGVAAPTFTDGLGKADCTFDTYTKGRENEKGYTFAGWFGDDGKELTSAADATVGTTYTAKWTKNGKTVRTTGLDLTKIDKDNTFGATLTDGVYTNADEGWSWNPGTKTLTLSGATMDMQLEDGSYIGVHLPADATVATAENTENAVSVRTANSEQRRGCAIGGSGDLTISGKGILQVVGVDAGISTDGDIAINAPIDVSITGDEIAAIYIESESKHSITIHETLDILTPTGGSIGFGGICITESDGTTPARNVVIGVAKKYTVTYNTNGGSAVSSATVSEGNKLTAPEAPTKAGYTFLGWYKDAAFTNGWNFDADTVTGNTTLYAKWTEATKIYGISGTVYEFNSTTPASGVTVKLMKGDTQVASTTSATDGTYSFTGIAPGVYNIVAEKENTTQTTLVIVTNHDETGKNVTLPQSKVNSKLTVNGADTPDVVAGGLDKEAAAVKDADPRATSVKVEMTVESKRSTEIGDEDKTSIETSASGKTLEYLDIKVTKTVDGTDSAISTTANMMEIIIPYDMTGKSNITVYRNHGGSATAFTRLSALPGSGAADGTYYLDTVNHLIYVYTQKFSTYAIGYNTQSGGGSGSGGSSSSSGGSSSGNSSTISTPSAKNGTVSVSPKSASKGTTVTVTVTPDKGYVLETLTVTDASGKKLDLKNLGSGKYSFTMPASKVEVKATFMEDNTMLNYFVDVPASAYYYDAVLWAAEQGITGGTDATHFSPDGVCTRAQAVTFLWRAAGSPAPSATAMPFTDVAADSYYYNAVLWAMENGITVGTSSTTFSPDLKCSRAHIMTFLWRSEKSPAAGSVNPSFTDVSADAYYADAVLWAVKESVTNGTSSATFSPDADCTRAQIVTFIWRTLAR